MTFWSQLLLSLALPMTLKAQVLGGAQSSGLAGAGRASVSAMESALLNPAMIPHVKGYQVGGFYGDSKLFAKPTNEYGVTFVDNTEGVAIPAAFTYVRSREIVGPLRLDRWSAYLGTGWFAMENLTVGFNLKYRLVTQELGPSWSGWNMAVGSIYTPIKNLGVALVFDDVLASEDVVTEASTAVGAFFLIEQVVSFRLDYIHRGTDNPKGRGVLAGGFETKALGKGFGVRAGLQGDEHREKRLWALGLGWEGPNLSFDYAYQRQSETDEDRHVIDMRLQF